MRSFTQVLLSTLCLVLLASWISAEPVADTSKPFTLTRSAWQWDRSDIGWPEGKVPDKKEGAIRAGGWADYDFTVPTTGWYELYLKGGVSGWDREIFLDGKRVYFGVSAKDDIVATKPEEVYKQGNLPLTAGKHTLRIRRLAFPGILPASWELRAAVDARARITAEAVGFTILRAGESLVLKVTGGAGPAADYELLARKEGGQDTYKVLTRVAFPASTGFVTKTVRIPCTEEGVFALRGRVDGKLLYQVDLLANNFAVVDTKHAPTAPANARQTLLHDIDCVKQTNMGKPIALNFGYWETSGATRITTSAAGTYRESGDNNDPDLPSAPPPHQNSKSLASFSYLADVPQSGGPYLLEVDYPDDDRRTVNVIVLEKGTSQAGFGYPVAQLGSGYESGDWYPLSQKMLTHRVIFWTKYPQVRIALVSMNPAMRAAAARIRVSRLDEGLPAGPANRAGGRLFGSYMEEPGRWGAHFRTVTDNPVTMQADYVGIERWIQLCRYLGINYLQPTEAVYQSPTYDSEQLEGWFKRAYDTPRLVALMCEKYGLKYVPELHISAQGWFTSRVARKLVANPDDLYLRNWLGNSAEGDEWNSYHPCWNALHPAIQAKYIAIFGELVDKIGPTTALGGVSSRLMSWVWQSWNALPSLNWGYEDWTMKQFAKETGINVPGKDGDPERFRQRFTFLTGAQMRETWVSWRCQKILDYHRRLRDRIRQNNPNAVLYLPYYGGMDISLGSLSSSPKEQLREMGIDLDLLAKEPGIAIVPSAGFGRRDSSPETDQMVIDGILDPEHKALGFGFERAFNYGNAYFEVHDRIPVDKLGFPDIKPGGYCGAADGAGRNMLERLSVVLADQDSSTMYQGGLGYTYGQPEFMQEWLSEYKQLPKLPFTPLAEGRDPVAVWYRDCPDGFYCYTVNREAYPVTVVLQLAKANALTALSTGKSVTLKDGMLEVALDSYQLRAFKAPRGAKIIGCVERVPQEQINLVKQRVAFCQQLAEDITSGARKQDVTEQERTAFLRHLDLAWQALAEKHYWRARTVLSMTPMIAVFNKLGSYPENQLHRHLTGILQQENTPGDMPKAAPVLTAAELLPAVAAGSQASLVDSGSYNRDWQHMQVLKCDSGSLDLDVNVPASGVYRLSIGYVADTYGSMLVRLGTANMVMPATTSQINAPERTVFPVMVFSAGKTRLSLRRQGGFGLYGVSLQPVYRRVPSAYWTTIGPFPSKWGSNDNRITNVKDALTKVFPPESEQKFDAVYQGDGKQIRWEYSDNSTGRLMDTGVNFLYRSIVGAGEICYAATYITSPDDRQVRVALGADWWANMYLNGALVRSEREQKLVDEDGAQFNGYKPVAATLNLKKGSNVLLVKCHGGSVASTFALFVNDAGDLRIAPKP